MLFGIQYIDSFKKGSNLTPLEWRMHTITNILVYHTTILRPIQIIYMPYQVFIAFKILNFLTPCLAQLTKLLFLFKSRKSSSTKISSNSCR